SRDWSSDVCSSDLPIEQRLKGVSALSRFLLDIGCHRRGFCRYNAPKQRFLVGEVVVERAACKASGGNDLWRARRRISLFDEKVARCSKKLRAAFVGTLPIGLSRCSSLHACSLYVINLHTQCMFVFTEREETMKVTSYYPVIMTADVGGTAAFWQLHFDFTPRFTSDWYVHLQSEADATVNLAILDGHHDTIPAQGRGRVSGLLLNFEVEDVDAEYERLRAAGLPILLDLKDEPFGQRHFITADPNGVLIDVITPIASSAEFEAQYR